MFAERAEECETPYHRQTRRFSRVLQRQIAPYFPGVASSSLLTMRSSPYGSFLFSAFAAGRALRASSELSDAPAALRDVSLSLHFVFLLHFISSEFLFLRFLYLGFFLRFFFRLSRQE